jgi:hypothetical protein
MFIKLFDTNMVASNLRGASSNLSVVFATFELLLFKLSISFGVREKNATSEPEIKAEKNSNTTEKIIPNTNDFVNGKKVISKFTNIT